MSVVYDSRYWREARLRILGEDQARALLQSTAQAHRLTSVVNARCPLCDTEIFNALSVDEVGALSIRPNAKCSRCDFRLDACRHCDHFVPASVGISLIDSGGDFSHGRCGK